MTRVFQVLTRLTGAALVFAWQASALAAEPPFPVWVSEILKERLNVISPDEARRAMDEPLGFAPSGGYRFRPDVEARTCRELLSAVAASLQHVPSRFSPLWSSSIADVAWEARKCTLIERLSRARPSRVSHVEDFWFDERAPDLLPAQFVRVRGCALFPLVQEAMARGLTWRDMLRLPEMASAGAEAEPAQGRDPTARLPLSTKIPATKDDRPAARPLTFHTDGWSFQAIDSGWYMIGYLQAKGDFDGDGIADLLIDSQFGPGPNEGDEVTFDILTRRSPDGPLETLEWHPFRCFPPHGRSFFLEFLKGQDYDWPRDIWPYHPEKDPPQDKTLPKP